MTYGAIALGALASAVACHGGGPGRSRLDLARMVRSPRRSIRVGHHRKVEDKVMRFPEIFCMGVPLASRVGQGEGFLADPRSPPCTSTTTSPSKSCKTWPRRSPKNASGSANRPSSSPPRAFLPPGSLWPSAAACALSKIGSLATIGPAPVACGSGPTPAARHVWPGRNGSDSASGWRPNPRPRTASVPSTGPTSDASSSSSSA